MRRAALLSALLFGCASTPPASSAPKLQPIAEPAGGPLTIALGPHAEGAGCDQLLIDGRPSDLPTLAEVARRAVAQNPSVQANVSAIPACSQDQVSKVSATLNQAGIQKVTLTTAATSPSEPAADVRAAAQGTNTFALSLYQQLRAQPGNLFFSPLSVAAALGLVDVGAGGQTAKDLDAALGSGLPHADVSRALGELLREYSSGQGESTLDVANRLWAAQSLPIKPDYLSNVRSQFGAAFEQLDFSKTEQARHEINAWVSQQTHGKISELIGERALRPDTELVIANAVYFLGTWQHPFDPAATKPAPFTLASGEKVDAPMMHQRLKVHAAAVDGFQVVELPYGHSGSLAFDLLVPQKVDGLAELEKSLTPQALSDALGALKPAEVTLAMPRFTERSQFELARPLDGMGLGVLFQQPDLTAMTSGPVRISAVVHQAFVDVNEKGTEAAAATAVMGTRALQRLPMFTVTADHPFLFLIRDTSTGGLLFFGRLADPRS